MSRFPIRPTPLVLCQQVDLAPVIRTETFQPGHRHEIDCSKIEYLAQFLRQEEMTGGEAGCAIDVASGTDLTMGLLADLMLEEHQFDHHHTQAAHDRYEDGRAWFGDPYEFMYGFRAVIVDRSDVRERTAQADHPIEGVVFPAG